MSTATNAAGITSAAATAAEKTPQPITDFDAWLAGFEQPTVWVELATLATCAALAWLVSYLLCRLKSGPRDSASILFGRKVYDGVLFPLLLLAFAYAGRAVVERHVPLAAFRVALPVLVALAVIRTGVKVLQVAYAEARWVRAFERSFSWMAWGLMVLWVSGLLPIVLEELDQIHWTIGNSTISLRTMIEGTVTAGAVLIVALWISSIIESRLLKSAVGADLSLRMAVSNATRALLMFLGVIIALSAVGIDLTALSVLGGAIGVGIGFGLQKLAANYVSGFVILAERSMRIGDNVRVDGFEGRITQINARYTVIRSLSGRESIVPNEMLITNRVENLSLADRNVWQSTVVSVGYESDTETVQQILVEAANAESRVLADPAPNAALSAFGADGLEFTLGYWIADPENGTLGLRSAINLRILQALRARGIEIPYPQRVVHMVPSPASGPALPAEGGALAHHAGQPERQ